MNKILKIILAIMGGIEVIFSCLSPILLVLIFIKVFGVSNNIFIMGLIASLFRGIKYILKIQ